MSVSWLLTLVFASSVLGTGLLRRYALARNVMDVPNDRSSHRVPTPRGGGVAIVVTFLVGVLSLAEMGHVSTSTTVALVGSGGIVALIGFLDDHRPVAARWRLLAHFTAAIWALAWLGGFPPIEIGARTLDLGWAGEALAALALVWMLNLYNFMDGIDGIAGVEALTVCIGAAILYRLSAVSGAEVALPLLLAAAAFGFLLWNFPPAKIFMGDAGSGFLGLSLGILALRAAASSPAFLWSWIILLGVFVIDATITLIRRWARRERLYEAHRSHAYQHATQCLGRHRPVTLAVGAINLLWLMPIALLVGMGQLDGLLGTVVAYAPLIWLALRFEAGRAST